MTEEIRGQDLFTQIRSQKNEYCMVCLGMEVIIGITNSNNLNLDLRKALVLNHFDGIF